MKTPVGVPFHLGYTRSNTPTGYVTIYINGRPVSTGIPTLPNGGQSGIFRLGSSVPGAGQLAFTATGSVYASVKLINNMELTSDQMMGEYNRCFGAAPLGVTGPTGPIGPIGPVARFKYPAIGTIIGSYMASTFERVTYYPTTAGSGVASGFYIVAPTGPSSGDQWGVKNVSNEATYSVVISANDSNSIEDPAQFALSPTFLLKGQGVAVTWEFDGIKNWFVV
jgi:hypothetical protein